MKRKKVIQRMCVDIARLLWLTMKSKKESGSLLNQPITEDVNAKKTCDKEENVQHKRRVILPVYFERTNLN
ncbi:MAG TPA: hypothetical protein VFW07_05895 [Parafilimonas sp.]|nr:hypothetical protein [Parafilimonas sp.]